MRTMIGSALAMFHRGRALCIHARVLLLASALLAPTAALADVPPPHMMTLQEWVLEHRQFELGIGRWCLECDYECGLVIFALWGVGLLVLSLVLIRRCLRRNNRRLRWNYIVLLALIWGSSMVWFMVWKGKIEQGRIALAEDSDSEKMRKPATEEEVREYEIYQTEYRKNPWIGRPYQH